MNEDEDRPAAISPGAATPNDASASPALTKRDPADGGPQSMSGTDFQVYIGRGLRAVFDDVAKQPIPDRFLDLMKKLG